MNEATSPDRWETTPEESVQAHHSNQALPQQAITLYGLLIGFLSALLLSSNVTGLKPTHFLGTELIVSSALFFYPLTYVVNDVINEFFGYKMARKAIQIAFMANIFFCFLIFTTLQIVPITQWPLSEPYTQVGDAILSVFIASMVAYLVSEHLNAFLLAKIKVWTNSRWLYLRVLGSTLPSTIIDSLLFCSIAFGAILEPSIIGIMIVSQIIVKSLYTVLSIPLTYAAHSVVRKKMKPL